MYNLSRQAKKYVAFCCYLSIASGAAAQTATSYQINAAHTGAAKFPAGLKFPLVPKWSFPIENAASYPIIAGGRVFVLSSLASNGGGNILYAINATTGAQIWQKAIANTHPWAALTYGAGQLFVLNADGKLTSLKPGTGFQNWATQMPGQYFFTSAPTFSGNKVFVSGAGSGGTLYAVNAADGSVAWKASVINGDQSSPAVSATTVYVSYATNQAYAFSAATGQIYWHNDSGFSGGGGKTTVLSSKYLYTRDAFRGNLRFDKVTGEIKGDHVSNFAPAISLGIRYCTRSNTIIAENETTGAQLWTFKKGTSLVTAPIVVNGFVFVGSNTGILYALSGGTGEVVWSRSLGKKMVGPDEQNVSQPLTGLAAGEGLVVVPALKTLFAFGSGI